MRWTIAKKLFLAILLTSLVILALSSFLTRWSFQRGFLDYVAEQEIRKLERLAGQFADIFERHGDWERLQHDKRIWHDLTRSVNGERRRPPPGGVDPGGRPPPDSDGRRPPRPPGTSDPLNIVPRIALFDAAGRRVAGNPDAVETAHGVAIVLGDETVGELRIAPATQLTREVDVRFASRQIRSTYLIALAVFVIAACASLLIARQLTRPIKSLTSGAHAMTAGRYDERITVISGDELGELATDFNQLASTLSANRLSRRQWIADISHELRTPLAILTGELQAVEDGIRQFDPATRQSLQMEVDRLSQLVRDLYELSLSDEGGLSYQRSEVDINLLLREALDVAESRLDQAGLTLLMQIPADPLLVFADATRLTQLFTNLIENTLRYTEAPGMLRVSSVVDNGFVQLKFADSAPAVPMASLPRIFDRLFRVEASRSRATGGSGLGLSICQGIVSAHGGTISAAASDLGGLQVEVRLPLNSGARTT